MIAIRRIRPRTVARAAGRPRNLLGGGGRNLGAAPGQADPEAPPTPLAAQVALSPGAPRGGYEQTLAFSVRFDTLAAGLVGARKRNSLAAAREAVGAAGFAAPEWFRDINETPDAGEAASQWRPWLQAGSWAALQQPHNVLAARALFQWLATWDVDFCLEYFQLLEPKPLLPRVAPMFDPRVFEPLPEAGVTISYEIQRDSSDISLSA
ncbi:hypothetical protein CMPELA_09325 [Cupriavidus necator]|uniref:Uncharacterized protein n=1 Tax=Cupriavidus necator (strain ATCC 17699 / DSM 428 / KCTC 22496 / NCIMB 10442 / H16 / Stanier 337) TaxID=381666 RepID=Q0KAM5_CUPNH|nr:Hypothetical protein H16_A1843 [Cupriavidus necator H16]